MTMSAASPGREELDEALAVYEAKKADWLRDGKGGQYVLIYRTRIAGLFPTRKECLDAGHGRFGNVPFLVREIREKHLPLNWHTIRIKAPS
jgi:hypothetical protein